MRTQTEVQAIAIVQSQILIDAQAWYSFMKRRRQAQPMGITVGSDKWHKLIKHIKKELQVDNLTKTQRKRLAMVCEGSRHRSAKDYRAAKTGKQGLSKFASGQDLSRSQGVNGSNAALPWMAGGKDEIVRQADI